MWPAILGAAATVGSALLGAKSQKSANEDNYERQKEFAQMGIQWKVEDAKRAGLHPLYALGGSGATYSPSSQPIFDGPSLGQNLSRAASAFTSSAEQKLRDANLKALEAAAEKDFAAAAAFRSEAARNSQVQTPPVAESFPVSGGPVRHMFDSETTVDGQAPLQISGVGLPGGTGPVPLGPVEASYLAPGVKPGFQRYNTSVAGEVILPAGGSMSEAVESMENPAIQVWIIAENLKHYGPAAERKLRALLGDKYKWWTNPAGAVGDSVRSFGRGVSKWGGN